MDPETKTETTAHRYRPKYGLSNISMGSKVLGIKCILSQYTYTLDARICIFDSSIKQPKGWNLEEIEAVSQKEGTRFQRRKGFWLFEDFCPLSAMLIGTL